MGMGDVTAGLVWRFLARNFHPFRQTAENVGESTALYICTFCTGWYGMGMTKESPTITPHLLELGTVAKGFSPSGTVQSAIKA